RILKSHEMKRWDAAVGGQRTGIRHQAGRYHKSSRGAIHRRKVDGATRGDVRFNSGRLSSLAWRSKNSFLM
ncbi:MAG: hypothetical protein ABGX07_06570, partial [Pirellulaceae bacterium]